MYTHVNINFRFATQLSLEGGKEVTCLLNRSFMPPECFRQQYFSNDSGVNHQYLTYEQQSFTLCKGTILTDPAPGKFHHKVFSQVEPVNYSFTSKINFMPKQKGVQKYTGTMGDVTHYKTKDGHLSREKGGVGKSRIQTDAAYQRTRENMTEFSEAGKAGKLIRQVFRSLFKNTADGRVTSRLHKALMAVLKSDAVSARGERKVAGGDLSLLEGFEFNVKTPLTNTLYAPYTTTLDRATGQVTVAIPVFAPGKMVSSPNSGTHFKIVAAAAEIDFLNSTFVVNEQSTAEISLSIAATEAINLQLALTANTQLPLFLVMGIEFYQEVNGQFYLLQDGSFNALSLLRADKVVTPP